MSIVRGMEQSDTADSDLRLEGNKWMERIRAAEKRESTWMKDAEAAEKAYACNTEIKGEGKLYDFNILHSNVETIVPAIYNSTPVPDVRSRQTLPKVPEPKPPQMQPGQQPDPRAVAQFQQQMQAYQAAKQHEQAVKDFGTLIERSITVQIDDNKLDKEVESAAQDAFLSGRGIVRLRFHADVSQPDTAKGELLAAGADEEMPPEEMPASVANERITYEAVSWRDFRRGPAKRWEELPWIAFRHSMAREEYDRIADRELLAGQAIDGKEEGSDADDEDDIVVWEVWCKDSRSVKFVRDSDGKIIKMEADPLGLSGFFPVPSLVQPIVLTGRMTPVCPFSIYKRLADELDLCTKRINAIMKGLKVRGLVAGDAADVEALAQLDDNQLGTIKGSLEMLAQTKGIEGAILWWPVEQSVKVLKELYLQREAIKQSIYELTGISDIVRGASNAGETATAQQIKTQWGSLRIQKMQRLISRMVRDLFIMSAEIITTKFSPQTLQQMTGIQITPQIQEMMNETVLAYYRVDVESDSTVKADTTRLRAEMGEFLQGTGAFFQAFAPVVASSPEAAAPVSKVFQSVASNYNLGKQASEALDELAELAKQAATKPRPNPEMEKLKAEMEMKKADHALKAEETKADMAVKQQEAQMDRASRVEELQIKREIAAIDKEMRVLELLAKREELNMRREELQMKAQASRAETAMGLQAKQAETSLKLDAQRQSNELKAQQAKQPQRQKADAR